MKKIILIFSLLISTFATNAQFYNGLQMHFGKNRIQYKEFYWRYLHYEKYDIYYQLHDANLGKYTADNIENIMAEMSIFFGIPLQDHLMFIIYDKLSDFRQSNIGLTTGSEDFLGGQSNIIDNKIFIYYQGNHKEYIRLLRQEIARLYLQQVLYGNAFTDKLSNNALLNVPEWFEEGLVSFLAQPYNPEIFNKTKDFLQTHKRITFNHLTGEQAQFIGHSFWYFIDDKYGKEVITNLLYFSKVSKNIKNAIFFVIGESLTSLTKQWRQYYEQNMQLDKNNLPDNNSKLKITKKKRVYQQFKASPDGSHIAYVENNSGRYKIFIYDTRTQKKKKIYQEGHKLDQIVDYSYPQLTWNYNGKILAYTTEKKSILTLWIYKIDTKETKNYNLKNIYKVNSMAFSNDGKYLVLSAVSKGYTDLFYFNNISGQFKRITYDFADDMYPQFTNDGKKIIFSSNRTNDTLKQYYKYEDNPPTNDNYDLFVYDLKKNSNVLTRLTNTPFVNETQAYPTSQDKYIYLSDTTGIINRFSITYDSAIAYIDTSVHYRYFSISKQLTQYSQNIEEQDYKNQILSEKIFNKQRYNLYKYEFNPEKAQASTNFEQPTYFATRYYSKKIKEYQRQQNQKKLQELAEKTLDSLRPYYEQKINSPDSSFIDINNYEFEIEKDTLFGKFYAEKTGNPNEFSASDSITFPHAWLYRPTFYTQDILSQIDFSLLNQLYQPFTGGPYLFMPGMSLFTTVGANELFNNYRLTAGFRWGFSGAMEYLFSIENLKKRLDKQLIYHRQTLKNRISDENYYPVMMQKTISNEMILILKYPFSQVNAVKLSFLAKYDRTTILSTEYNTLVLDDTFKVFSGAKLEYVFDNTRELSLNLPEGTRFKIFGEFYQQVQGKYDYTTVIGGDFRFYKNIFRNMIFATRFAGATSFGTGHVIFYLGSEDNTLTINQASDNYFDKSININYDQNYLFQAAATNLRGFPLNIRNGNTFLVSNTELRMPIIQMLVPYPLNSDFWHNLQIVGFFDIGSAWAGKSPQDPKNLYNSLIVQRGAFTVIVDIDRPPFVYGYGFGLRSRVLGYFLRLDWGWGIEGRFNHGRKFYLSLAKDF